MVSTGSWGEGTRFFLSGTLLILLVFASAQNSSGQQGTYNSESLFIAIFSNGDALVEYDVEIHQPLAEETPIQLFAESSIANLIVVDYEDNVIDFDPGTEPNEIVIRTPGVANARISYTTQDLLSKTQGRWIFSLDSASTSVTVKLPPDSVLIDPGENFPTIRPVGDQQLLTFKPGAIRFVYVIGVLGTEEQANIVIRLAETTIRDTTDNYPGIVLTSAQDLLQRAIEARNGERFPDAESLAFQANDAAIAIAQEYDATQTAITEAEAKIREASGEGQDTSAAGALLDRARSEFNNGNYESARGSAENAVSSIGSRPQGPDLLLLVVIIGVVAAGGGIGAMLILRSRKPRQVPQKVSSFDGQNSDSYSNRHPVAETPSEKADAIGEASAVPAYTPPKVERTVEQSPAIPSALPESQTDKLLLERIVVKIVDEKPHLRPEDQEVLRYLAEKEGAAFESEIRSKFQLPKTTIWRLVKRLEREELVEIRKAGGQNLIKLKFESRMP